jgi:hypothetical protein
MKKGIIPVALLVLSPVLIVAAYMWAAKIQETFITWVISASVATVMVYVIGYALSGERDGDASWRRYEYGKTKVHFRVKAIVRTKDPDTHKINIYSAIMEENDAQPTWVLNTEGYEDVDEMPIHNVTHYIPTTELT